MNITIKNILSIALFILLMACTAADVEIDPDADVNVTINTPEYVSEDTFEVTMDVTGIVDLNGGQFDLIYDPDVLKVLKVEAGDIDDTEIPVTGRDFKDEDYDRYKVIFKLNGADCVSGSGYLAKITFEVVGGTGDTSIIDVITDPDEDDKKLPILSDCNGAQQASGITGEITANWFGTTVTIGTAPAASDETPTPTPTETPAVNATPEPESAPTPTETPVTESLDGLSSNPFGLTASAESAPAAAVPGAPLKSSEDGGLAIPKSCDIIPIYSLVGLFALIYAIIQFK
jgi:hypothetical protein